MRNINIRYKITTLLILFLTVVTSSCLKDDGRPDFSGVGNVIEMLDAQAGVSKALNATGGDIVIPIRINQAGPDATDHDIVVTVGLSQAGLDLYNTDKNHVVGTMVPADAISFPSTVTIKHGLDSLGNKNRTATVMLTIHTDKVPTTPGVNYVISFGALDTSPATTISGNFGAILFNFYHNAYDGWYKVTGTMVDNQNPDLGEYPGLEFQLVTINATTSSVYTNDYVQGNYHPIWDNSAGSASYYGAVGMIIAFNSDNTVKSITNAYVDSNTTRNRTLKLDPTGVNKYDPVSKTLKIKYIMHQDDVGDRTTFDETWTFDHP